MPLYDKAAKELLLEKLNKIHKPEKPFTTDNSYIVIPNVNGMKYSTKVRGKQGSGYKSEEETPVERQDLVFGFKFIKPIIASPTRVNLHKCLDFFNSKYGLNLTTDDVYDANWGYNSTLKEYTMLIRTTPTSIQYTGSITAYWQKGKNRLSNVLINRSLGRLNFSHDRQDGFFAGSYCWSIDFTEHLSKLNSLKLGTLSTSIDNKTLNDLLMDVGLPEISYFGANISRALTTTLPNSNSLFTHALVIKGFKHEFVVGPIYLHYFS